MKNSGESKQKSSRGWLLTAIFCAAGIYFLYLYLDAYGIYGLLSL